MSFDATSASLWQQSLFHIHHTCKASPPYAISYVQPMTQLAQTVFHIFHIYRVFLQYVFVDVFPCRISGKTLGHNRDRRISSFLFFHRFHSQLQEGLEVFWLWLWGRSFSWPFCNCFWTVRRLQRPNGTENQWPFALSLSVSSGENNRVLLIRARV